MSAWGILYEHHRCLDLPSYSTKADDLDLDPGAGGRITVPSDITLEPGQARPDEITHCLSQYEVVLRTIYSECMKQQVAYDEGRGARGERETRKITMGIDIDIDTDIAILSCRCCCCCRRGGIP